MPRIANNSNRRGVAAVECAFALPLLIVLILGTIEACHVIFIKQSLTVAAFEGARVSIVPGADTDNVEAQVFDILNQRGVTASSVVISPSNFYASPQNTFVTVTITASPQANASFISSLYSSDLSESVTMMKEY